MESMKNRLNNLGNKNKYSLKFLVICVIAIAVVSSIITGLVVYSLHGGIIGDKQLSDIISTYEKISKEYYDNVDNADLATSAIDGMMSFLQEKYSIYMDSEETDDLNDRLKGNYEGVGISIVKNTNNEIYILNVYDNTPASDAGVKANDIILEVNGHEIGEDTETTEIVEMIQEGNNVHLKIKRDGEIKEFDLKKEIVDYPVVGSQVFKKDGHTVGYLELASFNATADKQVSSALKKLEDEGIESLILDLRGNTGGYLAVATSIANMFLKKGKVIYSLEGKTTYNTVVDTTDEERTYDIVVLMDAATASASEILASALKESYGAILVGTTSYGKGKVQQTSTLSDDTMIKYTTAKWFTPRGDNIDAIGLKPGIEVYLTKDYLTNPVQENDLQLMTALEVLCREKNTIK